MRWTIAALLCLMTLPAHGQAFGTYAGMPADRFSYASKVIGEPEIFVVVPSETNPNIQSYHAWIGPNVGLCVITGYGQFEADAERRLATFIQDISAIYGQATPQSPGVLGWRRTDGSVVVLADKGFGKFELSYGYMMTEICRRDAQSVGL